MSGTRTYSREVRSFIGAVTLGLLVALAPTSAAQAAQSILIEGAASSADDPMPVILDADLYLPEQTPAPAIVLAHGFGGSKASVAEDAQWWADQGYVVLAYTARGFGESTGAISMNSPEFEVADAQRILDDLAERPEVITDSSGDPRVAVAGGSYGGALALLLAGYDDRVDAVAADITWADLESALLPQFGVGQPTPGVYKSLWTSFFFASGLGFTPGAPVTECGRFSPEWCAAYLEVATTGTVSPAVAELMRASSPVTVGADITAPVLLAGGEADSLFPLSQADLNAQAIVNAPLKVLWHAGGHDGGVNENERLRDLTATWFDAHLRGGPAVPDTFEVSLASGSALNARDAGSIEVLTSPTYPGLFGDESVDVPIAGPPQQILAPAGGEPAAITALPGAGGLGALAGDRLGVPAPGQTAVFVSEPLASGQRIIGSSRVQIVVAADRSLTDAVLYASLRIVGSDGRQTLPQGLVSAIRVGELGPEPVVLDVILPTIVAQAAAGERLAVTISTTDFGYRNAAEPAVYTVKAGPVVTVPTVAGATGSVSWPAWVWPIGALLLTILIWIVVALLRPRYHEPKSPEPVAPLAVTGLVKEFRGGVRAVDDANFEIPSGVVVGLLGPNGAGKTTTIRVAMGLIAPTAGDVRIFGEVTHPGSPVLARVGCFVEGPGFLPHLSGRRNLDLFWRASGRMGDPQLDEVLEIAGLGSAVDRRVRTYSQGMRQRLGIAQAMLGMPDLLVLDEPMNGLDPPQIREMRDVLRAYAEAGRTVIVSSHLLSEVEQTCSHVVVMNRGTVVYSGTVEQLLAGRSGLRLEDVFLELVGEGHGVER